MMQWPESGRYQKLVRLDAAKVLRACLPILALFTADCALVDAQQREIGANGEAGAFSPHAEHAPAFPLNHPPLVMDGLPLTVQTPALMAVIASREAMTRKQWPALDMLVAQAKPDPLGYVSRILVVAVSVMEWACPVSRRRLTALPERERRYLSSRQIAR